MIRLIIDGLSDGHQDLFLKIDVMPSHLQIADSYFLFHFLEITEVEICNQNLKGGELLKFSANKLIDYWIDRIKSIERGQKKFIPFDLSDQYVGGFLFEKSKLGFKIIKVWTDQLYGFNVTKSNLDKQLFETNLTLSYNEQKKWLIGEQAVWEGLAWSKTELLI